MAYPSPTLTQLVVNETLSSLRTDRVTTNTTGGGSPGSVGEGSININTKRIGGFGDYGHVLVDYTISYATPSPQFDCALSTWCTHTNLTTGSVFGAWIGANTPSSGVDYNSHALTETYTGGSAIGLEVNVGNRWTDFGLQSDVGGTRCTVGLQVVPDIVPASDGPTSSTYPGSFGIVLAHSITGHKWWTGTFIRPDTIMPAGHANVAWGGFTSPNAPLDYINLQGYWTTGIDLSSAAIASFTAINYNQFHNIVGGGYISTGTTASTNTVTGAIKTAGGLGVAGNGNFGGYIAPFVGTVAQVAALTSPPIGARATVTDATAATFNATLTGGGSTKVPVWFDGSVWRTG